MPKLSVVAIPVRDEAERIGGCLAALARQSVPTDHIVLLLNNCTDRTADLVRGLPQAHHRLHIIESKLDESLASAGFRARTGHETRRFIGCFFAQPGSRDSNHRCGCRSSREPPPLNFLVMV